MEMEKGPMKILPSTLIEWKDAYNIGFARFDLEHQRLMLAANRVIVSVFERQTGQLTSALADLSDEACAHFDEEERLMEDSFYPQLRQHRDAHNRLMRELASFAARARKDSIGVDEVSTFLLDWLLEHILQADVQYAAYFQERGLA